jgi:hypothetical protein
MTIEPMQNPENVREEIGKATPILNYRSIESTRRSTFGALGTALLVGICVGLVIGLPLMVISFVEAGGGHGSYFVFSLASSPLIITGSIVIAWFGIPIWWGILAGLATRAASRGAAVAFVFAMVCHYLPILWSIGGDLGGFGRAGRDLEYAGLLFYAVGQITLWAIFVFAFRRGILKRRREFLSRPPTPAYYTRAARRAAYEDQPPFAD